MSPDAEYIYNKRSELCCRLQELIKSYYSKLSGDKEEISLKYSSDLSKFLSSSFPTVSDDLPLSDTDVLSDIDDMALRQKALLRLFQSAKERDSVLRYTSVGIQRDDIEFSLGDHPIKKCGSQGQQKSFLIALKLAQFTLMKELHGCTPILLLDDVFDKLDMQRVEYLLGLVASEDFGQIFITDSNKVRMDKIASSFTDKVASFEVIAGVYGNLVG